MYFGIQAKPTIIRLNIFALFFIPFAISLVNAYVYGIERALLRNKDYYHMDHEQRVDLSNRLAQFGDAPTAMFIIISGFIFELFGRKFFMVASFILLGLCMMIYPLGKPHPSIFMVAQCL